jgi:4-diphosphocytidyl-2-C-methyl-D-erythritol kinase
VSIGTGAGDLVRPLPELREHALLVVPQTVGLSTTDVYREADALRLARPAADLTAVREVLEALSSGTLPGSLFRNDLQPAALSLAPQIETALRSAVESGCEDAIVCGSGPTVIGICWGQDASARVNEARDRIAGWFPGAVAVQAVRRRRP